MGIRKYNPTTPGLRGMTVSTFEEITKDAPEKSLTVALKKNAGRNSRGKNTVMHGKMNAGALSGTGAFSSDHSVLSESRIWYRFDEALCGILNVFVVKFLAFTFAAFKLINDVLDEHHVDEQGQLIQHLFQFRAVVFLHMPVFLVLFFLKISLLQ